MITLSCEICLALTFASLTFVCAGYEPQESLECRRAIFYVGICSLVFLTVFVLRLLIFIVLTWSSSNPRRSLYCFTKVQLSMDGGILLLGIPILLFLSAHYPKVKECLLTEPIKLWVNMLALAFFLLVFYAFLVITVVI